jgi:ATP-dependent Clp protease adaptor protein ClpS
MPCLNRKYPRYTRDRNTGARNESPGGTDSVALTRAQIEDPGRTATIPRERQDEETRSRALDPYQVILHNDDVNSMDHVVRSLLRSVPGLSTEKAVDIMMEAHNTGRAVVIVCPIELAELVRDRLQTCGLTATIEQA